MKDLYSVPQIGDDVQISYELPVIKHVFPISYHRDDGHRMSRLHWHSNVIFSDHVLDAGERASNTLNFEASLWESTHA